MDEGYYQEINNGIAEGEAQFMQDQQQAEAEAEKEIAEKELAEQANKEMSIFTILLEINKNLQQIIDNQNYQISEFTNPNGNFLSTINSLGVAMENFKVRY